MKIQTFSILAGSEACNARCPFCVSKMTLPLTEELENLKEPEVNWRNFRIACALAKDSGVTTAMFTGKGEPTLFPGQITKYLEAMTPFAFPLIEMQTNGIMMAEKPERYDPFLKEWYRLGLTLFAISVVHYDPEKNREVYLPYKDSYIDLSELITRLHAYGFSVRLTCIMANGFIDSREKILSLLSFAKTNRIEQLTVTPVNKPDEEHSHSGEVWQWTNAHHLTDEQVLDITQLIEQKGSHLLTLQHGARVFDVAGQNICLNSCLTMHQAGEDLRNLIFHPDGHLRYYWQYEGATLL
ncbi:radical SAM protein [Candidatus Jorgensenbacteria bacterium]|nr:radical SAM protein [Candidatus Jorgensenbacteria bacterium]